MNIIKYIYNLIFKRNFGNPNWKKRFSFFGKNSHIQYPAILQGYENISIGNNTIILKNSRIQVYNNLTRENANITIGDNCYICTNFTCLVGANIKIGNNVLIASYVLVSSENHGMNPESDIPYMNQPLVCEPVSISDGCWIGEKVCILPGTSIGKKCIIGAGSVVTRSIPDYSIAVGNPARVIKTFNFSTHSWKRVGDGIK